MKHARADYNRIQGPAGKIGEDEPVFLIRANDITAPRALEFWASLQRQDGGSVELAEMAEAHAKEMLRWQEENGCKFADL